MTSDQKKAKRAARGVREIVAGHARAKTVREVSEYRAKEPKNIAVSSDISSGRIISNIEAQEKYWENFVSSSELVRDTVMSEARARGYLDGEKTKHISFRATPALVEAAMRVMGVDSPSELGTIALAMMAHQDPAALALKKTRGSLGKDHELEY